MVASKLKVKMIFLVVLLVKVVTAANGSDEIVIRMPGVKPARPDTYLCTGHKLPDKPTNVIGYVPLGKVDTVHHIGTYLCAEPGLEAPVWNCGEMGGGSETNDIPVAGVCASGFQLIYSWELNAPAVYTPKDVGVMLPAGYTVVVEVHYNSVEKFKSGEVTDNSGIKILTTNEKSAKSAAVYVLGTEGGSVPKYGVTYLEIACQVRLPKGVEMHPLGFRIHTHKHGRVVSGYRVRHGAWTEIGRGNPRRLPQTFYEPTGPKNTTIRNGDWLAARCTMYNRHNSDVHIGETYHDEMCTFYLIFWVNGDLPKDIETDCGASGSDYDNWSTKTAIKSFKNAPLNASEQPPLGKDEEEVVEDEPESVDTLDPRGTLSEDDPDYVLPTELGGRFYMDQKDRGF